MSGSLALTHIKSGAIVAPILFAPSQFFGNLKHKKVVLLLVLALKSAGAALVERGY